MSKATQRHRSTTAKYFYFEARVELLIVCNWMEPDEPGTTHGGQHYLSGGYAWSENLKGTL